MDVRNIFKAASDRLAADFAESSEVGHQGGKGTLREDALGAFLGRNLPSRYGVGRGQVINSDNRTSGQLDIVIHDPVNCPRIIPSPSHSIFPIESVFGAVSIKSDLSSTELFDAYANLRSLNDIVDRSSFTGGGNGLVVGMAYPRPVTVVFAYGASRSLEAVSQQVLTLDLALPDIGLRPDFVCVLGKGIIGPRNPIRGGFNKALLPGKAEDLCAIRRTERHTLFRFYLQLVRELGQVTLRALDLARYDDMPKIVGPYRVSGHDAFALGTDKRSVPTHGSRLTLTAIRDIVTRSHRCSRKQAFEAWFGAVPEGPAHLLALDASVFCYNPRRLPPMSPAAIKALPSVHQAPAGCFCPIQVRIDGTEYFVDVGALPAGSFEDNPDLTLDELTSR